VAESVVELSKALASTRGSSAQLQVLKFAAILTNHACRRDDEMRRDDRINAPSLREYRLLNETRHAGNLGVAIFAGMMTCDFATAVWRLLF
jgi:hypothetical protein